MYIPRRCIRIYLGMKTELRGNGYMTWPCDVALRLLLSADEQYEVVVVLEEW